MRASQKVKPSSHTRGKNSGFRNWRVTSYGWICEEGRRRDGRAVRCAVLRHCHALRANHAAERARRLLSKLRWYVDAVGRGRSVAHSLCNHHLRNCFRPTDRPTRMSFDRSIEHLEKPRPRWSARRRRRKYDSRIGYLGSAWHHALSGDRHRERCRHQEEVCTFQFNRQARLLH